ncbi:two-component system sensor histidine kinase YesM [Paenibacillus sp. V4I3]|uniref:sensor histidine kinase n=1 Tax=unclassified Paenibacillus TaxID=185978 RepID=UPI00278209A0|nr:MULTISPECIES: histidine kinase [unclassified Paenibacillus]MDQ0877746.1 two-component system sensor histidine kinase YesM [Paenibacillus sp. V4I3]MDQ0886379.1 two-component system sensor histidine kinase YesM [Paenibacillus sp. V4I9]
MKRSYLKKLPITMQLSLLGLLIVMVMISIMAVNYYRAVNVVKKNNSDYIKGVISQLNQSISSNSNDVKRIMETIAYNGQTVQNFLSEKNPVQKLEMFNQLKAYLSDMRKMKKAILDIALVENNGAVFNFLANSAQIEAISREIPRDNLSYFLGLKMIDLPYTTTPVLVAGVPIYSTTDFEAVNSELGTLLLIIDNRLLFGDGNPVNLPEGALIYMADRNGRLFYTNDDSSKLGEPIPKDRLLNHNSLYMIQREAIPDMDGEIVIAMPNHVLLQGLNVIRQQQLIMVAIALVLMIIPLLFVSNNILLPLKKFMRLMGEVSLGEKNHLSKRIDVDGYAEMIIMASRFNEMLAEIEKLTDHLLESKRVLYESELIKRRAELSFLQSQINPHFLYNTLESIKGLAAREGSSKIFELTKALAMFFRYSIKGPDMISLEREWIIIKNYIFIHQIRFGERLHVEYDIPTECLACLVPKMILQPIVENAIKHGIEPLRQTGVLVIKGYRDRENLYLSVNDNGTGISLEQLEEINNTMECLSPTDGLDGDSVSGIGLANVHKRIRMIFGEPYGIRMTSELEGGTTVSLTIPVRGEGHV